MTARKLAYSTTSVEAVRLAKPPVTKANAMQLLKSFLANGAIVHHDLTGLRGIYGPYPLAATEEWRPIPQQAGSRSIRPAGYCSRPAR